MKITLNKSTQGPVLAKGTVSVTPSIDCGVVGSGVGCETTTDSGNTIQGSTNGTTTKVVLSGKKCC